MPLNELHVFFLLQTAVNIQLPFSELSATRKKLAMDLNKFDCVTLEPKVKPTHKGNLIIADFVRLLNMHTTEKA